MNYKISNRFYIRQTVLFIFSTYLTKSSHAQVTTAVKPSVTHKWRINRKQAVQDSGKRMMELKSLIPNLVYDLRYAGPIISCTGLCILKIRT